MTAEMTVVLRALDVAGPLTARGLSRRTLLSYKTVEAALRALFTAGKARIVTNRPGGYWEVVS